ncbi:MAG: CapA family protein [Tannerella sp.]|jgi:CubicO group peptidase (beta-lactamase class C family)/poly-gamma-glutamate capsule biosynthesis protein CapA/YwtB (metallophosphatase superfamily)|nr:CapA family protein [Tannerella sp.]
MKRNNRKSILITVITAVCLLAAGIWTALPPNYYIRKALIHLMPEIDQYPIFENRIVKAGDPQPWPFSEYYNKLSIPDKYKKDFDLYGTVAYVIIQNGELLFEQYWDDYSPQSHSNSFSMAKSIISIATGCAIDDGVIRDVDQPVSDFFPQFGSYNRKQMTIRHLLTMSAGVDFQEAYTSIFSPTTQLYYGNDLDKITFEMKQIEEPGVNFIYQSGVTQLLTFILEKATGENISSYVSRKLWTPLQAEEDAIWSLDRKDGFEKAYCCFNSNARDFARLGQLVLNGGKWNDKQIVTEQYVKDAVTADSTLVFKKYGDINRHYGYQFWLLERNGIKIPYLRGIKGQYVFIIPEKNAIVVRLGHKRSDKETDDQHYPADIDIWLDAAFDMLDETPKHARLLFGGDMMQHIPQVNAARDSNRGYDYTESFRYIKPLFEQADLSFINLETTLTASMYHTGFPLFRSPKEIAGALSDIGIDVAVMANNHVFDGGKSGVTTTMALLDSAGIKHTGVFTDSRRFIQNHPLILRTKGLTFALFNYTYGTNGLPTPDGLSVNRIDSFTIARDIALTDRSKIDCIIVFFHWGYEYSRYPDEEQKTLAGLCHRYGAEIVVGSHPHVVQPITNHNDTYTDNSGDEHEYTNVTIYSLGNLVSNQRDRYQDGGIIVTLEVMKKKNKPLTINTSYTPVWVKLPKYNILPPSVADTIAMSASERFAYEQYINDTKKLLSPDEYSIQAIQ